MRARLHLRVLYDAPAFDCRRVVRVLPRLSEANSFERLTIFPTPTIQQEERDRFDNRVLVLRHTRIEREFLLRLEFQVLHQDACKRANETGVFKMPSRAVFFAPAFGELARPLRPLPALERARKLNALVFKSLSYHNKPSDIPLNAREVWARRSGTCADFAHVLLALCRVSGIPARYVAGFGPAPGALHAWVEVEASGGWHAFDPTHSCEVGERYVPVAVGRDFYDCAPHRGVFHGQDAHLELECELRDGT